MPAIFLPGIGPGSGEGADILGKPDEQGYQHEADDRGIDFVNAAVESRFVSSDVLRSDSISDLNP